MAGHDNASILRTGEQQANIAIAFIVLAWVFIALRVWTRTYMIANFGWDDATMILAGWVIVGQATYLQTVMFVKISLGIFFARIVVDRWHLLTIYVTVGLNIVSSTASFFYVLLRCGPNLDNYVYRQLAWKCTPRPLDRFFAYQSASVTTVTDCVFAVLPIFMLWNATMDRRAKLSVGFILSLGALGCICSMIRFQYVDGLTQIQDYFWNAANIAIWSTIEPGAGIIAGCLATLRPLLKTCMTQARSMRSSASRTSKSLSPSLPSSNKSSSRKYTTKNSTINTVSRQHAVPATDTFDHYLRTIGMSSGASGKGESTDNILLQPIAEIHDSLMQGPKQDAEPPAGYERKIPTIRDRPANRDANWQ
ncbi:hypothetical protein BU24DRAFT_402303 [Aaosphaeria arxii CBS 175.79]|uniref:Rhodopsin domain-containing protein n=1 Tax=Aaosphaeria arxii CBS 175.79 TaxID=1450172 RepID=A0A6A5X7Q9_9PLEO|nr:uncharacterized protein BU24DRAFT_402303 [Aaosphaeria arxii CBS 175.79]KAF2008983.1 hypothetical protein BU24DRAFT_402303 [Aaosphaeria arxii CBS 175.79]